jgi:hypothetical protein
MTRNPNTYDVSYVIGQFWQNTQNTSIWYLNSQTSANGLLQSNWVAIASTLNSISDTVNTPVYPSSGLSIPPDNIQLVGASGISVVSNAVANLLTISATGTIGQTITGNTGGPLIPTLGNWNILGDGSITSIGSGSTLTVELTGLTNHAVLVGAGTTTITNVGPTATVGQVLQSAGASADPAFSTATYPLTTTINQILYSSATDTVTGLATANDGVLITSATGVPSLLANSLITGYVLTANTAAPPSWQSLSSSGAIISITGNTGGAEVPLLGNFNILGTGSITVAGSANTETVQLTGLTNHAVLLGAGTSTITSLGPTATVGQVLQSAGASADPAFSTATYPLTTTVNQLLYSSATDTVTGLATANRAVLTTNATGVPALTALATDGQLIIGSTAGAPAAATLTAGSGIVVTNASNSITIAANGFALAYTNVTFAMSPYTVLSTDYYISVNSSGGAVTLRFPNAPTVNQTWTVKDRTGNASANNISVTTVGGAVTIDGATTYTIISNYGSINLINNATSYEVY